MRALTSGRLARTVFGPDVDPALRPLLVVSLLSAFAFGAFFSFAGIWAVQALHASGSDVGIMFALAAIAGTATAFAGGELSDRLGRKPVIVASLAGEPIAVLGLLLVHDIA